MKKNVTNWFLSAVILILVLVVTGTAEASVGKIGVVLNKDWVGESEFASRFAIVAKRLGIKVEILDTNEIGDEDRGYDFIIVLSESCYYPCCPNYLIVVHPMGWFEEGKLKDRFRGYDGYLTVFRRGMLAEELEPRMEWYPTTYSTRFCGNKPENLLHIIACWGDRVNDPKYRELYLFLDRLKKVEFYGKYAPNEIHLNQYKGALPFDGKALHTAIQNAGISLILHSREHLENGIPSGRIFEAAAASAVIISDRHPFVIEEFGDSVLYVDHHQSGESMGKEVQKHLEWVLAHPIEAKDMARRAHKIFCDRFTLEKQLANLIEFHEKHHGSVKSKPKKKGIKSNRKKSHKFAEVHNRKNRNSWS